MLGGWDSNTRCRKTGYVVRRVTPCKQDKSADQRVYAYGQNVPRDGFFMKVLLNLFKTMANKDGNSLHTMSKS